MRKIGPVLSLSLVTVFVTVFGAGCHQPAVAADPPSPGAAVAPPAGGGEPKEKPTAAAVAVPVVPVVLDNDPDFDRLQAALIAAGASHLSPNPAEQALTKTLIALNPAFATLSGKVQCYGDPDKLAKKERELKTKFEHTHSDTERKKILSTWPVQGCIRNIQYPSAEAVPHLDETTINNRTSPFNSWKGSNGRTAPRRDSAGGQPTIVASWYFLQPPQPKPYGGIDPKVIGKLFDRTKAIK